MQNLSGSFCGKESNNFPAALHLEAVAHQLLMLLGLYAVFNKHDLGVHGINYQADETNPRAVCCSIPLLCMECLSES